MPEVRTAPVVARHSPDCREVGTLPPGGFRLDTPDSDGEQAFIYACPCGCGHTGVLTVGNNFKPVGGPSWNWNGSVDKPTLTPSVHHVGHWHGWLKNGVWESC